MVMVIASQIKERTDIVDIVSQYVSLKQSGNELEACCPFHEESTPSFKVHPEKQVWNCFGCGKNGDVIEFVQEINRCSFNEAIAKLGGEIVKNPRPPRAPPMPAPPSNVCRPPPANRIAEPPIHFKLGMHTLSHEYVDQKGEQLFFIARYDTPEAGKEYRPWTWDGKKWGNKAWPTPRPLYGLDKLYSHPTLPVLLVEGEKCADAAQRMSAGYVAMTWPGGANAVNNADFSPLADRTVIMWPDVGDVGMKAMLAVQRMIAGGRILDVAGRPEKWDAAVAEKDGFTEEQFKDMTSEYQEMRHGFYVFDNWWNECKPGLYLFNIKKTKEGDEQIKSWISSPIYVEAITSADGFDFGRLLRFRDSLGNWRSWSMPMAMLKGRGEEVRGVLLSMGVEICPRNALRLTDYLQDVKPTRKIQCATQVGWCGDNYVTPDYVIGPNPDGVNYQADTHGQSDFATGGTMEGWQESVSKLAWGNPMLCLAISTAFAGPLIKDYGGESGGLHVYGDSSTGKTSMLSAASSVWGGKNFQNSWRTTAAGVEGVATKRNDCLLVLDEISECENPRDVGAVVYLLGNGIGKTRALQTGLARPVVRWRCVVFSTGEQSITTMLEVAGQAQKVGQTVRLLDIPILRTYGAWDDLHQYPNGASLSEAVKCASETQHYGHAGKAFVEFLTTSPARYNELLAKITERLTRVFLSPDGQERRAVSRLALIAMAGEIATLAGITGWEKWDSLKAAIAALEAWSGGRVAGNSESSTIVQQVTAFLEQHGESRFSDMCSVPRIPVRDRAGWWDTAPGKHHGEDQRRYYFSSSGFAAAIKGFDHRRAVDALISARMMEIRKDYNGVRMRIAGVQVRVYAVTMV